MCGVPDDDTHLNFIAGSSRIRAHLCAPCWEDAPYLVCERCDVLAEDTIEGDYGQANVLCIGCAEELLAVRWAFVADLAVAGSPPANDADSYWDPTTTTVRGGAVLGQVCVNYEGTGATLTLSAGLNLPGLTPTQIIAVMAALTD